MHVFGLQKEAARPGENLLRHAESMETPHKKPTEACFPPQKNIYFLPSASQNSDFLRSFFLNILVWFRQKKIDRKETGRGNNT